MYANFLNSGNEAIDKTNMRGQQTKIHYLAISKHAPSSRAIKELNIQDEFNIILPVEQKYSS